MGLALSSGLVAATAATVLCTGKCILSGVVAISDGTNTATVTVYDNASTASGTVLAQVTSPAGQGTNSISFVTPIRADNGLVIAVTGTGTPNGILYFGA